MLERLRLVAENNDLLPQPTISEFIERFRLLYAQAESPEAKKDITLMHIQRMKKYHRLRLDQATAKFTQKS